MMVKTDKVISTCLFGKSPRAYWMYARQAPQTAKYLKTHLPDWKFRMYYDDTAPKDIIKRLQEMDNTQLIEMPRGRGREGCFWRFLAFDDCKIAVCRDLDFKFQENDLICIKEWLQTDYKVHYAWVVHNRLLAWQRKNRRYFMAGCVSARELPFSMKDLIEAYPDDKAVYGADEYFLGECFMPEVLKHQKKVLMHIEPQPKYVPKGKVREYIELFPDTEKYIYLEKNWVGI